MGVKHIPEMSIFKLEPNGSFSDGHFLPINKHEAVVPHILRLLTWRCPSAVPRLVAAPTINTIQCFAGRPLAHIGPKVLEFHPASTDDDAATTIPGIGPMAGVCAPLYHRAPSAHFGACCSIGISAVFGSSFNQATQPLTPTTTDAPILQSETGYLRAPTAIATAEPHGSPRTDGSLPGDNEKAEPLPNEVVSKSRHAVNIPQFWPVDVDGEISV